MLLSATSAARTGSRHPLAGCRLRRAGCALLLGGLAAGCDAAATPRAEAADPPPVSRAGAMEAAPVAVAEILHTAPAARAGSAPVMLPGAERFTGGGHKVADVAAGAGGALHAVFLSDADGDGRGDRVWYARSDGAAWSLPQPLDETPGPSEAARVAVDAAGRVHVLWFEGRPSQPSLMTEVRHRVLEGGRWSAARTVYREPSAYGIADPWLDAVADADGRVHLLHVRTDGGPAHLIGEGARWRPAPAGEQPGTYVRWDGGSALDYVYVAAAVQAGERRANNDVWYQPAAGGWPLRVYRGDGYSYEPQLLTDRRGVRHLVWREGDRRLHSDRLLYATSADGRSWTPPREVRTGTALTRVESPRLVEDASGVLLTFAAVVAPSATDPGGQRHFRVRLADADSLAAASLFPDLPPPVGALETVAGPRGEVHAIWKADDGIYRHAVLRP